MTQGRTRDRSRDYDVVIFGASGFTGALVAEYLVRKFVGNEDAPRLALAGRNQRKLEEVRAELAAIDPRASEWPIEIADSFDRAALDALAGKSEVICTTVGPYAKYGERLVAACVENGTDYCDLTGETHFIRRMIDDHQERAEETGARIVCSCGFDSIPSDLGTLVLQDAMTDRYGVPAHEVRFFAGESKGSMSGGTIASMLNIVDEAGRDGNVRRVLLDPYALNPEGERSGPDGRDQFSVRFDDELGMWTGPFLMAGINTRVVRRSHALMGFPWGRSFRYSEAMSFGRGPRGFAAASAVTAGLGGFMAATGVGPLRKLLEKRLPSPGEGPDREAREAGHFTVRLLGRARTPEGREVKLRAKVQGFHDPGYGETARMLGESALCLAIDGAELDVEGGILTPATAMGMRLVERLREVGMVFEAPAS